ncbi:uncharacterized protein LOC124691786 isoform X1 [Lolium rigidum]|uniref:uncharacterized protein LOC124691786 isoform X1 n=2 Tax=Lolium rigidum TaxID=89674 RepID=UPI001F5C8BAB|nr:uncharacterized protein LOC124691786 isoform X1 [Lolium rigidum]XP_047081009.1 uncharacterized protein LOC124691786 isoform X1 [Lolium rigidum]XP_047081010.1 uncharacterized protein LOC124691786 isoform X1 [Lolium rigidum]XP_047081011.1 uncharacterized protein LOC124691786 isoform X1 [Lolium rigidum]
MLKRKRDNDCTTGSSKSSIQKACTTGGTRHMGKFGDLHDSCQGVWNELNEEVISKLSKGVVAVASFKGNVMMHACSGIVIRSEPRITTLLTSTSLVRSSPDDSKIDTDLKIRARTYSSMYVNGWLKHYDLEHDIAIVDISTPGIPSKARLRHKVEYKSGGKVIAVGRVYHSRKLMATSGTVIEKTECKEAMIATCKISKAEIGGPLIDVDGNFLGMNICSANLTFFVPRKTILQCLGRFGIFRNGNKPKGSELVRSSNEKINDSATSDFYPKGFVQKVQKDLLSCGYPLPKEFTGGMKLINSFDTKFPSLYGAPRDVQNDLIEKVSSSLSPCVVSLASFNGETRLFACTGIAIECNLYTSILTSASLVRSSDDENKIDYDLRIEVHLPNKQRVLGELQHSSLHYNIAVVKIQNSHELQAVDLYHQVRFEPGCNMVAIGRLFKSGKLMATCGRLTDEQSKLDCKELSTSTCKISKVGIGGPLVDPDGYFVGMNFYEDEVTPFLPRKIVLECLSRFKTGTGAAENINSSPNRWPVPKPYWTYPMDDLCASMLRLVASPESYNYNLSGFEV